MTDLGLMLIYLIGDECLDDFCDKHQLHYYRVYDIVRGKETNLPNTQRQRVAAMFHNEVIGRKMRELRMDHEAKS